MAVIKPWLTPYIQHKRHIMSNLFVYRCEKLTVSCIETVHKSNGSWNKTKFPSVGEAI